MNLISAAPWDGWDLPGYALPSAGTVLGALVLVAWMFKEESGKGRRKPNDELNRAIERVVGGVVRGIGRFLAGRDLVGEPRTTATWWRSGVPVGTGDSSVADLTVSSSPRWPKRRMRRDAVHWLGTPLRMLISVGRGLAAWSRWPHAARSLVRLGLPAAAWGLWLHPDETRPVLIGAGAVAVLVVLTGPGGLEWWEPRKATDDELYGPGVWAAVRQVLRLDENAPRKKRLSIDADLSAEGARIVLLLPLEWMGGKDAMAALQHVIDTRIPGEWAARWERAGAKPYVEWTRKPAPTAKPVLPGYVQWKSTGNRFEVFVGKAIEGDRIVDVMVQTQSATPHWGVGGDTGSGKSTVLYIPVVHARQHGELIDILDTKQNSLIEAEGASGVRIHKTVRSCVAAFAEFMVSMMAAEAAMGKGAPPGARAQLVPRTLVIDELPTLIKLAYVWWRYGIKGKGTPPFLDWFSIILLQGRSSDHRIVVGTQQFANSFFGGTMERAQIGSKFIVGLQDRISWGVAFGQSTPVIQYDTTVKGRGAFADKRQAPDADHLYVREFQPAYITPMVATLLADCPPAPDWFDAGQMAPWITDEALTEADLVAGVRAFLPGGAYGPSAPTVTPTAAPGTVPHQPSSAHVTSPPVTSGTAPHVTTAQAAAGTTEDDALPPTYSLAEACAQGIVPWQHSTARQYKKRSEEKGVPFPEGIPDGRTTHYTEEELRDWVKRWKSVVPSKS
ncbi:hypothetical protein [Streptomyces hydrogenans]